MAVLFVGVGQLVLDRQFAHRWLGEFAYRENGVLDLMLLEHRKKVGLVLVAIDALHEIEATVGVLAFAHIVAGCQCIKAVLERIILENAELHLAVAHDVGIRGDAVFIPFNEVVNDVLAVFVD